ncbi:unnamed protein product [Rhizophagus irregularis]|nr:unnamed protein product [Rhizophagus irregularis]CAB4435500.1 unnamed protein product [Rhizophagus irregularis]CAB5361948.1 unnamed protein product [Rhizophagus irregularis]
MVFFFCCRTKRTRKSMGSDNQNQRSITSEIQTSTYNTNDTETEQFDEKTFNNDQDTISKKQDENQQQTNQFTFDRPVTVSDVLEGKITLPTPAPKKQIEKDIVNPQINNNNNNKDNNKVLNGKKEIQRLSTTDSMQEFLEIPDNIVPNDYVKRDDDDENNDS